MRVAVAIVFAVVMASVLWGMLRSLRSEPANVPFDAIEQPPPNARVTYWCETCGTEVLLLRAGSKSAPRHCGEAMVKREEVVRGPG